MPLLLAAARRGYARRIVDFTFDPDKDAINRAKHGVPLLFGARVFDDAGLLRLATIRAEDEELRYKAVGLVDGNLWTAVHVERDDGIRLVSVRRGNGGERHDYDDAALRRLGADRL